MSQELECNDYRWEPTRLRHVHRLEPAPPGSVRWTEEYMQETASTVYHYRPYTPTAEERGRYVARGCNATRFYIINELRCLACEHELLAD